MFAKKETFWVLCLQGCVHACKKECSQIQGWVAFGHHVSDKIGFGLWIIITGDRCTPEE